MKFDPAYILANYFHDAPGGAEYVYYPATYPRRLLVTFASLNETGELFNRIRHFWSEDEQWGDTEFLFFRDKAKTWYLDIDPYLSVIRALVKPDQKVFVNGSCMGAWGALTAALSMTVQGVLLASPRWPNDREPEWFPGVLPLAPCYAEARGSNADQLPLSWLTTLYRDFGGLMIFRSMPESFEHWAIDLWKPDFTFRLMDFLGG